MSENVMHKFICEGCTALFSTELCPICGHPPSHRATITSVSNFDAQTEAEVARDVAKVAKG